ncbi:MAG: PQQ-binding-like beta-propeller repeat protein [Kofleriaceae bacterium]
MPTMQATRVRCPECGATTAASGELALCTYCGTQSRVQRRTQVFQRPIPLPPLPHFVPVATQVRRTSTMWLVLGIITVLPMVVGGSMCLVGRSLGMMPTGRPVAATSPPPPPARERDWESAHPIIADVDGDGIEDVIGIQRQLTPDGMRLAAVSGADGHVLWSTPDLGAYIDVYRYVATLAGETVLFFDVTNAPRLVAYDAHNGANKWDVVPPEIVSAICGAGSASGKVTLVTKDEARFTLELATGGLTPQTGKKTPCPALPSTDSTRVTSMHQGPHHSYQPPGMSNDDVLGGTGSWIVTGHKKPGTEIPMLAVIDDKEKLVWSAQVPGLEPMKAKRYAPEHVWYDARTIAVGYERPDHDAPPWLTAFDRATGRRLFEREVAKGQSSFWRITEVRLGTKLIYVTVNRSLRAFDRETGAPRWAHGQTPDP